MATIARLGLTSFFVRRSYFCFTNNFSCIKFKFNIVSKQSNIFCTNGDDIDTNITENLLKDDTSPLLVPRSLRVSQMPHQVFIIHPYIKWGKKKKTLTNRQLQLEEAVALIKTLPGWIIVDTKIITSVSFDKKTVFNSGQLDSIKELLRNENITSLFVNTSLLKVSQLLFLEEFLNIPVFDRYSIIINIFKAHAITTEAKLQVALAEIPFVFSRICGGKSEGLISRNVGIGSGETFIDKRFRLLNEKKRKLANAISVLRSRRALLRSKRMEALFPIVAVVGYTNAGKTSLIKCLTEDDKLKPEDKLFATLDVTAHEILLPFNIKAILMDTIGFIDDIPTDLMEPFVATLEDALIADIVIHVKDVSHPDEVAQEHHVLETLKKLNLSNKVIENIITVGNKCDKNYPSRAVNNIHLVSCLTMKGIEDLKLAIAESIIKVRDMKNLRIRVKNGGAEYQWLIKESGVIDITVDQDPQYLLMRIFISDAKFNKFKSKFI